MKLSPKQRQYAMILAPLLTAAVGFSFGRMTNWLSEPTTPGGANHAANGSAGGGSSANGSQGNSALADRVGGAFKTDDAGSGTTVDQITGGKSLEEWLKKLMEQDDDIYRTKNFMRLVEALNNPDDIKTALKVLSDARNGTNGRGNRGGPFGGRMSEYGMLVEKLAQIDPKVAISFAADQKGGDKFMATSTAMRTWAKTDPSAALAWAQSEGANLQMDFGGGRGGPGGAGATADGQDGQPKENFALMSVLSEMAKTDLDKAMSAASTADIGRMGGRMVGTLADEMVSQRGVDAAKKAVDTMPDGDFRNEYIQSLARQMSSTDAPGAAGWANTLPSGDAKRRALGQAVGDWAANDPAAAGAFLAKLPASVDTDSARASYATNPQVLQADPASALQWASTITDPERRGNAEVTAAAVLLKTNPTAGNEWLAQSSLTDEQKMQVAVQAKGNGRGGGGFGGGNFGGGGGPGGGRRGGGR